MRKPSQMGGGEFEYHPEKLEEKINQRMDYLEKECEIVETFINERALKYMSSSLGTIEGYKEYILKELVKDFRGCEVKFRRAFKPTMDERLKDHLKFYRLIINGYEHKCCATCINRKYEEYEMWNGLKDYDLMCKQHEDNTSKCSKYEKDLSVEEDTFKMIKNFILNEYEEE